jgi:uncharacterized protein
MIIEAIFSTVDRAGCPNFAPMGLVWGEMEMTVRPFRDTRTCRNLMDTRAGVVNVTDDVLLFARAALSDPQPAYRPASYIEGVVLQDVCSWRELEVMDENGTARRASFRCRVVGRGVEREFLGFNRARGAVIEAAILATRLHLHNPGEVGPALGRYAEIVSKTGGHREEEAMHYVRNYVKEWYRERAS